EGTFSGGNLKTVANADGSINIQMADAPKFGDITINNDGRITGVADGKDGKDAVNMDQLGNVTEIANKGWQLQANGDAASKVAPGDTVQFIDGNNIEITRNGNDLTFSTADNVAFNKVDVAGGLNILGGGISISGGNRIDFGNNVIHNIAKGVAGSDAVNVDQLNEEIGKIKWYVDGKAPNGGTGEIEVSPGTDGNGTGGTGSGNGGSQPGKPGGNTVTMEGKDNISVTVDGSNNTVTVGTSGKGSIAPNSKDVITGGQVYDVAVAIAENTKNIIGGQTKVTQTRDGEIKHSVEFDMAGGKQTTINDAMKAIDNSAVHYDKTADGKVDKSKVTLGEKGTEVTVGNVAAGVKDNDAVNVSQLKGAVTKIDNQFIEVNNQIGDIHNNMGRMDQKINKIDKDSRAGVAAAMAAAGLPQAYLPGKSMMAIAGSTWRGETGYAIGVSTISDNGNWVVKANMSGNARSQYGASAGVGYQW
ncbi:MAG: YadA family autotransporter adhesin, partial [Neisseriaceae bacterium]